MLGMFDSKELGNIGTQLRRMRDTHLATSHVFPGSGIYTSITRVCPLKISLNVVRAQLTDTAVSTSSGSPQNLATKTSSLASSTFVLTPTQPRAPKDHSALRNPLVQTRHYRITVFLTPFTSLVTPTYHHSSLSLVGEYCSETHDSTTDITHRFTAHTDIMH